MAAAGGGATPHVVIVGAGPAGLLAAHLLLNRGKFKVTLVERGPNYAKEDVIKKRSWMIGLAVQGLEAMRHVPGLYERLEVIGIRGKGAFVHIGKRQINVSGGLDAEKAESYIVDRNWIVAEQAKHLESEHGSSKNYAALYHMRVLAVDGASKSIILKDAEGLEQRLSYDLLLGCDGVRSVVRDSFVRKRDFQVNIQDINNAVKSIHVPCPAEVCNQSMHIVTGTAPGGFGFLALPELDGDSKPGLWNMNIGYKKEDEMKIDQALLGKDAMSIAPLFKKYFGHLSLDWSSIAEEYVRTDFNSHSSVKCNFYHLSAERMLLLGDAAHATSPAIGQGMNTALEDARVLHELMLFHDDDLDMVLPAFTRTRVKEGRALTEISQYAFSCSPAQQMKLTVEDACFRCFPRLLFGGKHPNLGYRVGANGEQLSLVYDEGRRRLDDVRRVNDRIIREHWEATVGLAPPRPQKGCECFPLLPLLRLLGCGGEPARPPCTSEQRVLAENGLAIPGFVKFLFKKLPTSAVQDMVLQPPDLSLPDLRDVGGVSPYEVTTVVPGQVWSVKYTYQPGATLSTMIMGGVASSSRRNKILGRAKNPDQLKLFQDDFARCDCCSKIPKQEGKKGAWLKAGLKMINYMLVLATRDGGLLLYSPVKVDHEMKAWLEKQGRVDWIVSSCGNHTTFIKSAKDAFPDAKVVASWAASMKVKKVGVTTDLDYVTEPTALKEALAADFEVLPLEEDPLSELCLLHRATGTLCISDLLYTDKLEGLLSEEQASDPEMWMARLMNSQFFFEEFASGLLPTYRYHMLQPDSPIPSFPAGGPHRRRDFGRSVARLLALDGVQRVCSAHLPKPLDAPFAKLLLRRTWGWACEEALSQRPVQAPAQARGSTGDAATTNKGTSAEISEQLVGG